jgi:hypothetical protein
MLLVADFVAKSFAEAVTFRSNVLSHLCSISGHVKNILLQGHILKLYLEKCSFFTFLKDELARLRRQSVSRVPTVRASATIQEGSMKEDISNAKNLHEPTSLSNSTEGCFLHFGRALPSPTILNNKVKLIYHGVVLFSWVISSNRALNKISQPKASYRL